MNIYRGPWRWDASTHLPCWSGPEHCTGALDARPLSEQSVLGAHDGQLSGVGIFVTSRPLNDSNYDLLAKGNWHDIKSDARLKSAIPVCAGFKADADDLVGLIYKAFTLGASPDGSDSQRPLMPQVDGRLALHLGGMSLYDGFNWDTHDARSQVRDVIRSDVRQAIMVGRADARQLRSVATRLPATWQQGSADPVIVGNRELLLALRLRGLSITDADAWLKSQATRRERHYRKVMGFLLRKYRLSGDRWRELVPADLLNEVDPPEEPETTYTESFNKADASTLGPDLTWTMLVGTMGVRSNTYTGLQEAQNSARAEADLSSADHYAQVAWVDTSRTMPSDFGVLARHSSSAHAAYGVFGSAGGTPGLWRTYKVTSGAYTALDSGTTATEADGDVLRIEVNGSTISRYLNGVLQNSSSDGTHSGHVRCGVNMQGNNRGYHGDSFEMSDLAAGGIVYTQHERGVRGLERGMWQRWGG